VVIAVLPEKHVFVCNTGVSCAQRDSAGVYEKFRKLYKESGLKPRVLVTGCGSVGFCDRGVAVIVYPEGVWYSRVTVADVDEIWQSHVLGGKVVERLRDEL
jgi:(2Fe-2S) ferredoxin